MNYLFQTSYRIEPEYDEFDYLTDKFYSCIDIIDNNTLLLFLTTDDFYQKENEKTNFLNRFNEKFKGICKNNFSSEIIYAFSETDIQRIEFSNNLNLYILDEAIMYFSAQFIVALKSKIIKVNFIDNNRIKEIEDFNLLFDIIQHFGSNNFFNVRWGLLPNNTDTLPLAYPGIVKEISTHYRHGFSLILLNMPDNYFLIELMADLMKELNSIICSISAKNYKNLLNSIQMDDDSYLIKDFDLLSSDLQIEFWKKVKNIKRKKLLLVTATTVDIECPFPQQIKRVFLEDFSLLKKSYPKILGSLLFKNQIVTPRDAKLIATINYSQEILNGCPSITVLDQAIQETKGDTEISFLETITFGDLEMLSSKSTIYFYQLKQKIKVLSASYNSTKSRQEKHELIRENIAFIRLHNGRFEIAASDEKVGPVRKTIYLVGIICLVKYFQTTNASGPISAFHLRNLMYRYEEKDNWKSILEKRGKNKKKHIGEGERYLSPTLHPTIQNNALEKLFGYKIKEFGIRVSGDEVYLDNFKKFNFIIEDRNLNPKWFSTNPDDLDVLIFN
ncbi:MAG: hypothetical protein WCZ90_12850 [Melioribacteraceae bacterium]